MGTGLEVDALGIRLTALQLLAASLTEDPRSYALNSSLHVH